MFLHQPKGMVFQFVEFQVKHHDEDFKCILKLCRNFTPPAKDELSFN